MINSVTIVSLFEEAPFQWGVRGDPHLWKEMREHFGETLVLASADELGKLIETAFESITSHSVNETDYFFVERFGHGGMSSGLLSPPWWKDKIIPLMCERYAKHQN